MSYLNAYLDECAAYGWSGGPEFNTRVKVLLNGRERRNADWSQGRHRYTLPFNNISQESYRAIRQMFEVCRGMLHGFRYVDPLDHESDNEEFGEGDGSEVEFQLSKLSVIDGVTYQREVYALPSIPTITINGVQTAGFVADMDRGLITFSVPPANGAVLRWTGSFDVWVRFNQDWLPFSIDNKRADGYAHNGSIELIELPPPEELTSAG